MSTASSPTPRSGPGGADGLADAASVVVEGLHKSYGSLEVLKGISLSVGAGQVVCLIGPSGSGKSTLLRCVNLLETPQQGRITIGDFEVTDPEADVDRMRRHVGMVFQQFNLFPHLNVLENCTVAQLKVLKWDRAEVERIARAMATRCCCPPESWSG